MKKIDAQTAAIELKIVALGKVASELETELARIKHKASKPAPAVRNLKKKRMQAFAEFYLKRKIVTR